MTTLRHLWETCPAVHKILSDSPTLEDARDRIFRYITSEERKILDGEGGLHPLERANALECIRVLKNVFSKRSERLAKFSALKALWKVARGQDPGVNVSEGFVEEFKHLFLGMLGRSGIYDGKEEPKSASMSGREAALQRCKELDDLYRYAEGFLKRYVSGLDEEVKRRRERNRERIMKFFGATEGDWEDWRWHLKHVIRDSKTLGKLIKLTEEERKAIDMAVANGVPFGITPYYVSLMDEEPTREYDHAIRAQVIPPVSYVEDVIRARKEGISLDFMRETDTSPHDLITRRYPTIAIFKPYNTCAQICVYCQRNWEIKEVLARDAMASRQTIESAIEWFRRNRCVREVLVTGGDPLITSDEFIDNILSKFAQMDHMVRIRIGTRTPVVLPQRITERLADILAKYREPGRREILVVTHVEHVAEVTEDMVEAVQRLRSRGICVCNQEVFTVENSRRFESVALRRLLRLVGIEPYYTFNMKGKDETRRYRVPIARLLQEQKEEARLFSGVERTDNPVFNVPRLGKVNLNSWQDHALIMILPNGSRIYEFHPWEKNVTLANTYIYTDVPIHDYLMELRRRREDLTHYKTIWYYF